jgi:hypothetical protein
VTALLMDWGAGVPQRKPAPSSSGWPSVGSYCRMGVPYLSILSSLLGRILDACFS